ncbi:serine protease persephone [Solenopsis invicta]|uniref:serine protease persephone n=1 Tax=Solenopsis invicta TaxID=13686 RepID=UPI00193EAA0C|nr:serine protease persephone [Solenopsis invicta]
MPPILSSLLQLVLVSILSVTYGQDVGQSCVINNSAGVCKLIDDCPPVYQESLAGKMPSQTCGELDFNPIVCCPITNPEVTKPTPAQQSETIIRMNISRPLTVGSRGSVARAKCAKNAEAVYGLVLPPTPTVNHKPINISLCALKTHKLVVGGKKADPKEFPHMAAVGFGDRNNIQWFCGGSLISAKIVLTAAHCIWTPELGNVSWVRLGDLNLVHTNDSAMTQTIAIEERIKHPDYKRPLQYHDIAILRLKEDATYNAYVRPACLPVDWPDVGQNDKAVATGWGQTKTDEEGSDHLLKVTLKLVSHEPCNASYCDGTSSVEIPLGIDNDWQICAGEVGKDTCQGDSGGPLVVFNTDHQCMYNVIGVTSLGRLCASIIPGVYTRVYHYIPWIERTAWPEDFLLLSILSVTYEQGVAEWSCVVNNSPGVCRHINDCPQVSQELSAGKMINLTCESLDLIVCCPTTNPVVTEPISAPQPKLTKQTNTSRPMILGSPGIVSKTKCAEYADDFGCPITFNKSGNRVSLKNLPYMVTIGFGGPNNIRWFCAGSLISSKIVLTAAHCTWTPDWGNATWIRLDHLNLIQKSGEAIAQTIAIAERITHPDYKCPLQYHDIAILRLKENANYTDYVRPACLPVDWPDVNRYSQAAVTGWIQNKRDVEVYDYLIKMTPNKVSYASCNASYFNGSSSVYLPSGIVDNWQICLTANQKCESDSGGPLAVVNTDYKCMHSVIGINSFGRLCGNGIPGVFTRVYHYMPWIERTAWPEYFEDIV